jgi:hypothetical protein
MNHPISIWVAFVAALYDDANAAIVLTQLRVGNAICHSGALIDAGSSQLVRRVDCPFTSNSISDHRGIVTDRKSAKRRNLKCSAVYWVWLLIHFLFNRKFLLEIGGTVKIR